MSAYDFPRRLATPDRRTQDSHQTARDAARRVEAPAGGETGPRRGRGTATAQPQCPASPRVDERGPTSPRVDERRPKQSPG
ncbi:hypothetical protein [Mycolicibacterium goodii]|uniref:hypothetical protein n=1 Tax=Mycolicibacterium goodii TaxID=134601 RepID=UPI00138F15B6